MYALQSSCPYQHQRHYQKGMSRLECCRPSADIWSLGILLALVATGDMPFPGNLDLLQAGTVLEQEQSTDFHRSVICHVVDLVRVRFCYKAHTGLLPCNCIMQARMCDVICCDVLCCDGMGWDGMGWDGMGCDVSASLLCLTAMTTKFA